MSLSQETLIELMALADGELEGEELARVERLVAENDEARQVVESMQSPVLGTFLQDEVNAHGPAADGIADAVMGKLGAGGGAEGGGVVRLTDVRARRASRTQVLVAVATAGLALAAGIALYVHGGRGADETQAPVASVGTPSVDLQMPPAPPSQGVEVNDVDSPSHGISVFEIPLGAAKAATAGPSSVVIMIEDDPSSGRAK